MTNEESIAIIRKEYLCVDRDCDIERNCGKCDLMMPSKKPILEAYNMAIKALETIPKYKDAYAIGYEDGVKATNVDCGVVWEERIEDIKAEIQKRQRTMMPVIPVQEVFEIIDKHCGGDNE